MRGFSTLSLPSVPPPPSLPLFISPSFLFSSLIVSHPIPSRMFLFPCFCLRVSLPLFPYFLFSLSGSPRVPRFYFHAFLHVFLLLVFSKSALLLLVASMSVSSSCFLPSSLPIPYFRPFYLLQIFSKSSSPLLDASISVSTSCVLPSSFFTSSCQHISLSGWSSLPVSTTFVLACRLHYLDLH